MGRLRTAIQLAMRAGKPIRKAADIVAEGKAAWAAGRASRSGLTAASIADDLARNAAMRPNIVRSGGGGIVPTGGSSMVSSKGGALMRQGSGAMTPYNQGGALALQGSGAMTPYNQGGALARIAPPTSIVTMFAHPGAMKPQVDLSDYPDVPDPSMLPRDPIIPEMTPGFTPTTPDMLPPPMMPRSPVPVTPSMPEMPMTVPPNMELPDVMSLAPRMPTMPDMSMGRPDITMPGFDVMFDHPDPTPGLMGLGLPDKKFQRGFLERIGRVRNFERQIDEFADAFYRSLYGEGKDVLDAAFAPLDYVINNPDYGLRGLIRRIGIIEDDPDAPRDQLEPLRRFFSSSDTGGSSKRRIKPEPRRTMRRENRREWSRSYRRKYRR